MDFVEWLRWGNATLALFGFVWLGLRMWNRWDEFEYPVQLHLLTLSFYVFGTCLASCTAAVRDLQFGWGSAFFALANFALVVTLAMTVKRRPIELRTLRGN